MPASLRAPNDRARAAPRWQRVLVGAGFALVVALASPARADKIDDLTHSLLQDSSYKVRVQAALVLGKLKDRRAVAALSQALRDDNATVRGTAAASLGQIGDPSAKDTLDGAAQDVDPFVRSQAQKAIALLAGAGPGPGPKPSGGGKGRYYIAVGFGGAGPAQLVRDALAHELQKLPDVALSGGGPDPSGAQLMQRKQVGFIVDGNVQKLSATLAGGQYQIDCDVRAFVATFPAKSVKMMTTEGAQLQVGASERESAKRDCIQAAAESIRDDVAKYLKTVQ